MSGFQDQAEDRLVRLDELRGSGRGLRYDARGADLERFRCTALTRRRRGAPRQPRAPKRVPKSALLAEISPMSPAFSAHEGPSGADELPEAQAANTAEGAVPLRRLLRSQPRREPRLGGVLGPHVRHPPPFGQEVTQPSEAHGEQRMVLPPWLSQARDLPGEVSPLCFIHASSPPQLTVSILPNCTWQI